jgi:hypothetical protein
VNGQNRTGQERAEQ